jgi:hypothetical protein
MAFFPELSPYTYFPHETPGTVNVGWLEKSEPFPTGQTSEEFRTRLLELCGRPVRQTRGIHTCSLCRGKDRATGSAEIRVAGAAAVYAAPELVHHYVTVHDYRPPEEFIAAVLAWDGTPWSDD